MREHVDYDRDIREGERLYAGDDCIGIKSDYALGAKLPNGHVRVTGSHLTSMHSMDNYYVSKLLPLMAELGNA